MDIAAIAIAAVLLILTGGTMLVSYVQGRGPYAEEVEPLDEKEFKTK